MYYMLFFLVSKTQRDLAIVFIDVKDDEVFAFVKSKDFLWVNTFTATQLTDVNKCFNGNLLYHGCIPMKENGDFDEIKFNGIIYSGKRMLDYIEDAVKKHLEEKK